MSKILTHYYLKTHRSGRSTWVVRWKDLKTGRWSYLTAGRTEDEAKIMESRVRESLLRGVDPRPEKARTKNYRVGELIDLYYQTPRYLNSKKGWRETVRGQFENEIRPELGKEFFDELKKTSLFKLYMRLKERGLSHSTIKKYHYKIRIIGELYAELAEVDNPIARIRDFQKFFPKQPSTRKIDFLTPEEIDRLYVEVDRCKSRLIRPLVQFLANTGFRRSEALALEWSDVDESGGLLHVRNSKNGQARSIPLEPLALEALRMLKRVGKKVFVSPNGALRHRDSFLQPLKRATVRAKLDKRVELQPLRHSYGSNKIRAGWGLKKVSVLLGHSDILITSKIYTHLLDGDLRVHDGFRNPGAANSSQVKSETLLESFNDLLKALSRTPTNELLSPEMMTAIARSFSQAEANDKVGSSTTRLEGLIREVPQVLRTGAEGKEKLSAGQRPSSELTSSSVDLTTSEKWRPTLYSMRTNDAGQGIPGPVVTA